MREHRRDTAALGPLGLASQEWTNTARRKPPPAGKSEGPGKGPHGPGWVGLWVAAGWGYHEALSPSPAHQSVGTPSLATRGKGRGADTFTQTGQSPE